MKLPSLRQLSTRMNVSISTIQYAYSLLEKEGRVYSVAKSGYFAWPVAANAPLMTGTDLLERLYTAARRPAMVVLSGDEPALLGSLDGALLALERQLVRRYPHHLQPSQPCGVWELRAALAARYTSSPTRCWQADEVYVGPTFKAYWTSSLMPWASKAPWWWLNRPAITWCCACYRPLACGY